MAVNTIMAAVTPINQSTPEVVNIRGGYRISIEVIGCHCLYINDTIVNTSFIETTCEDLINFSSIQLNGTLQHFGDAYIYQLEETCKNVKVEFVGLLRKICNDYRHNISELHEEETRHFYIQGLVNRWKHVHISMDVPMNKLSIHVMTDTDLNIVHKHLLHPLDTESYHMHIIPKFNRNMSIHMNDCLLERIYLYFDNSLGSLYIENSEFTNAGVAIKSQMDEDKNLVLIEGCTFHGNLTYHAVSIRNTSNVSIRSNSFRHLRGLIDALVLTCYDSQVDLKSNLFTNNVLLTAPLIRLERCAATMSNITISRNKVRGSDKVDFQALLIVLDSSLNISTCTIKSNHIDAHLLVTKSSNFNIDKCTFVNNSIKLRALRLYFSKCQIDNSIFSGNTNTGIHCDYSQLQMIDSSIFSGNTGIICAFSQLQMIDVAVSNNSVFMVVSWCAINMSSSTFTNNTRMQIDGGGSELSINYSTFSHNRAVQGGCFQLSGTDNVLHITESKFSNNFAVNSGGVFYLLYTGNRNYNAWNIHVSDCFFINNYAKDDGGIIAMERNNTASFYNCTFLNNTATTGGIGHVTESRIMFSDCLVSNNSASEEAGVISLTYYSTLIVENTLFSNNTCGVDGGVIKAYRRSSVDITNSSFIGNKALGADGGAVVLEDESEMKTKNCVFADNTAARGGGAVMLTEHSIYNDDGSLFMYNIASDSGGAVAVLDHSDLFASGTSFTGNKAESLFEDSDCQPGIVPEHDGGAIMVQTYSNATLYGCFFTQNEASDDGGAIYVQRRSLVLNTKSKFLSNKAWRSGGSILVQHSKMFIESCAFENESVFAGNGGSICAENVGNVTLKRSSFKNCRGFTGGSISVEAESVMNIKHCTVKYSFSNLTGGGLYINHKSVLKGHNVTIQNCKSMSGAGISISDSSNIDLEKIHLTANKAKGSGGAIQCEQSTIIFYNGNVTENRAGSKGGAMRINTCLAVIDDMIISDNYASVYGGGIFATTSTVHLHNNEGQRNVARKAGGFILITQKSHLMSNYLTLKLNHVSISGSLMAIVNSSGAEMTHTNIIGSNDNDYCPITIYSSSRVTFKSIYFANITHTKNSDITAERICNDSSSQVSGVETGKYPESCKTQCRCYSDRHDKVLVADCVRSGLTHLPSELPDDIDWLLLSGNYISSLGDESLNMTVINHISKLNVSANDIKNLSSEFLDMFIQNGQLLSLDISNNKLTSLPQNIKNMSLEELQISSNMFKCNCDNIWMKIPIMQMNEVDMACILNEDVFPVWKISALVVSGIVITVFVAVIAKKWELIKFWLFLCCGIKFKDKMELVENIADLDYDAFINYNSLDHGWVREEIVRFLENHDYTLCLHTRDFVPTATIPHNIRLAIKHSRRLISVVTRNYLSSGWCKEEFSQGHLEAVEGRHRFIILIMVDDINVEDLPDEMQKYVKTHTYIDATNITRILLTSRLKSLSRPATRHKREK